jgi:hypothetical protein
MPSRGVVAAARPFSRPSSGVFALHRPRSPLARTRDLRRSAAGSSV